MPQRSISTTSVCPPINSRSAVSLDRDTLPLERDVRQSSAEEPDHRLRPLLRARRERPRGRAGASPSRSFDDLVGEREHGRRDFEAKRLGGLKVQHQLELGWLLHGKIAGLLAPENAGHVDAGLAKRIRQAWTIADQAAAGSELAVPVDRGKRVVSRQGSNLVMDALEERIIHCDQGVHARVRETSESGLDFGLATRFR